MIPCFSLLECGVHSSCGPAQGWGGEGSELGLFMGKLPWRTGSGLWARHTSEAGDVSVGYFHNAGCWQRGLKTWQRGRYNPHCYGDLDLGQGVSSVFVSYTLLVAWKPR